LPSWADFDRDGDVDAKDFGHLQVCLTGERLAQTAPECLDARLDEDEDVDGLDVDLFIGCASGPELLAEPRCGG